MTPPTHVHVQTKGVRIVNTECTVWFPIDFKRKELHRNQDFKKAKKKKKERAYHGNPWGHDSLWGPTSTFPRRKNATKSLKRKDGKKKGQNRHLSRLIWWYFHMASNLHFALSRSLWVTFFPTLLYKCILGTALYVHMRLFLSLYMSHLFFFHCKTMALFLSLCFVFILSLYTGSASAATPPHLDGKAVSSIYPPFNGVHFFHGVPYLKWYWQCNIH